MCILFGNSGFATDYEDDENIVVVIKRAYTCDCDVHQ